MPESTTRFETPSADKYIKQLCKHFGHRVETTVGDNTGTCRFEIGTAQLDADASALAIRLEAEDEERLKQMQHVIESHLLRFAFREEPGALEWRSA
ncbi:DUF2218 domain-containing protein [Mesorhizobium sp. RP14(2022)]|uniref:DUF2218 domain-containing protein n=1 Tax=Mesorhizobium liriopis TaxID=2953882 RepID=A0ABT1C2F4_9HYPH|nr:DUF2218 domain-containing protein [Mesorhizobium liriopis]MCO6049001.1 DUF2218 domain-containing protein [Mesorhizobium liriopis]